LEALEKKGDSAKLAHPTDQVGEQMEEEHTSPRSSWKKWKYASREMAVAELSQEKAEQQLSDRTAELNFAAEWTLSATEDEEDDMGDHDDLPICREEMQSRRLHTQSQPWEQLDEEIEEIQEADVEVSTRDCQ
jgi:hypothetical protein